MEHTAKRISNFHLGQAAHSGERSELFEARYAQAGGVVGPAIVKVLRAEYACIGDELRRFLREVDWARALRHTLFPRVMEAGEYKGRYFLAMEKLDGWTLADVLRDSVTHQIPIPSAVVLTMVHQIADGMQSVHDYQDGESLLGVVHLGIEPSNIMLRRDGMTAVLDFGETTAAGVGDAQMPAAHAGAYQSPERLRMLPMDCRADVFSLGKVLEAMIRCMDPAEVGSDFPELVARATAPLAEERFGSMREFMDAMEMAADAREVEFSCHTCSQFGAELFGSLEEMRTDPRTSRPSRGAAPLRMQSEGVPTAHGLPPYDPGQAEASGVHGLATHIAAPAESDAGVHELETHIASPEEAAQALAEALGEEDMLELDSQDLELEEDEPEHVPPKMVPNPDLMATVVGGPDAPVPASSGKGKKGGFVDAHLAVTTLGGPLGGGPAPERSDVDASQEATAEAPTRKAWPQELVATKVYSQEPEDDDELASAIERLRNRRQ